MKKLIYLLTLFAVLGASQGQVFAASDAPADEPTHEGAPEGEKPAAE